MIMKKIYIASLLSVFLFTGCELERLPETTLTDLDFWKEESHIRGASARLYSEDLSGNDRIKYLEGFYHDTRADELTKVASDNVSSGNWTVPPKSDNEWRNPYRRIYVANNIIEKGAQAEISEAKLNRWLAESYFFRAYHYFGLVKKYGGVPIILKTFDSTEDGDVYKGRNTREEVIAQCYKDLEFAVQWLPEHKNLPADDWGRVTRSSALALTARIGLYIGTLTKYHNLEGNAKDHLKKSIDACELLLQKGHDLYPDFQKLFYFEAEGPGNKEALFVKVYGPNGAGTIVHGNSRGMENSVSVTRQMIDLFLYDDGLPREKSPKTPVIETSFDTALENRDPRLLMTVYKRNEIAYKDAYVPFGNQHGNGYSLKKGFILSEWGTNSKETVDKMLIRYAEVLITYAEALYEYNGSITDEQLEKTVNKMCDRVGFTIKLTNAFVSNNGLDMLEEIRRERTVEFIDENFRYDDIIRWKIAEKVLPKSIVGAKFVESETNKTRDELKARLTDADGKLNGKFVYPQADMYVIDLEDSRGFNPARDYLYPIPLNEIALTGGNITQNPGWTN